VLQANVKAVIPLPSAGQVPIEGSEMFVTGWGDTRNAAQSELQLRGVNVPIFNRAQCHNAYSFDGGITDRMVCAYSLGKDACQVCGKN